MAKTRRNKVLVFILVLLTVMNISISLEDLPNKSLLKLSGEVQAAGNCFYDKYKAIGPYESRYDRTTDTYSGSFQYSTIPTYDTYSFNPAIGKYSVSGERKISSNSYWIGSGYYLEDNGSTLVSVSVQIRPDIYNVYKVKDYYKAYYLGTCTKGELVQQNIAAADGAYPINGQHTDGYWYVKKTQPSIQTVSPANNYILNEQSNCAPYMTVIDPDGETLTCKLYIDSVVKETRTATNTSTPQTVTFNSLNIADLENGSHTLKFEVSDGVFDPVTQTINIIVDKLPTISNVACTPQDIGISISTTASDAITPVSNLQYRYTVGNIVSNWISQSTYSVSSLLPDTIYLVKVEVRDASGNIAISEQQVRTKLQVPQAATGNATVSSMDISVNDSNPAATLYQVMAGGSYVTSGGTLSSSPQWIALTNKKVTVTGLSQNTAYAVKVKAKNSAGTESGFSPQITAVTLAQPPSNIALERSINSLKLSWDAINNATYIVELDGNTLVSLTDNTYTNDSLAADSTHHYRVRTVNAGGAGPWSSYIEGTTFPNPPETAPVISITGKTQSSVTIGWDAAAGADGYEIEVDEEIDKDTDLNLIYTTATEYTHEGLEPDSLHSYHVRARNDGGHSGWSEVIQVRTLPKPPGVPQNVVASPSRYGISLSWDEAEGAAGYSIALEGSSGSYTRTTTLAAITIDGLLSNSTYTYKIRAYNDGGSSDWSNGQAVTTWPEIPSAPANIMASAEKEAITLSWYSSYFAEGYDIEIDGAEIINNITGTSYTNKGLTAGTAHSYRIRAGNISGKSGWSALAEISTLPLETAGSDEASEMANVAAVVTNKSVTISWQAVKAEVQYEVEADGIITDNGKDTVYSQSGLEPSTFHSYRVRTRDKNGNGEWCAAISLFTLPDPPNAPEDVTAIAASTQIKLSWTKEDGVAYEVEIDGASVDAGEVSEYIHSGLAPGTAHTYRVRGRNISGVTSWSNPVTISTAGLSYQIECTSGTEFNFALLASDIRDFGNMTFVVAYDPEKLEVTDLCEYTEGYDTASGRIPGTNITVQNNTAGRIELTVKESITPGTSWSGEITTIIFKPKIDGEANIDFNIE
ncbi:fibronectin type III domain protein [Ruminiclostridium sufflavum DSM 19573]|uniref:Fibronectin type III domain protein n=1 Tax=Ruminiclostridium sufflavum DSM 19573 TaxID=1121337 RepID=A0A318XKC9_9FIRM|nr:fibronectin type III domain-containing protein [Ruminiclostridium sufflavum]PYG87920.1 fibronectin type III domain protein [Ruminiclostridium sufflavum DSM 19573]